MRLNFKRHKNLPIYLLFGISLLLFPSTLSFITRFTAFESSLLITWPNHFYLFHLICSIISAAPTLPLRKKILILSSPVVYHLNIHISTTCTLCSVLLFIQHYQFTKPCSCHVACCLFSNNYFTILTAALLMNL